MVNITLSPTLSILANDKIFNLLALCKNMIILRSLKTFSEKSTSSKWLCCNAINSIKPIERLHFDNFKIFSFLQFTTAGCIPRGVIFLHSFKFNVDILVFIFSTALIRSSVSHSHLAKFKTSIPFAEFVNKVNIVTIFGLLIPDKFKIFIVAIDLSINSFETFEQHRKLNKSFIFKYGIIFVKITSSQGKLKNVISVFEALSLTSIVVKVSDICNRINCMNEFPQPLNIIDY